MKLPYYARWAFNIFGVLLGVAAVIGLGLFVSMCPIVIPVVAAVALLALLISTTRPGGG